MSAHGGGTERWLVSYADFITVLMALFIVLFSMGNVDIQKYKALAESLRASLGMGGGPVSVINPGIDKAGGLSPRSENAVPAPIQIPGIPMRPLTSDEVATQLYDLLNQANLDGSISVQNNIEGVLISLSEQITFQPGTANFTPRATAALDRIIAFVAPMENQIKVVGHTDNTPPADERFKNNWELSLGRALAVIEYMQSKGIPGYRLIAAGRGQYEPLFPNDTPQRRALNSRVEIIIIYKVDQNVINPIPTITP